MMVHDDTCRLLGECDAGIQMAIRSIDEVLPLVESAHLRQQLSNCRRAHEHLRTETHSLLGRYEAEGKTPGPHGQRHALAAHQRGLAVQPGDQSVADLMIDRLQHGHQGPAPVLQPLPRRQPRRPRPGRPPHRRGAQAPAGFTELSLTQSGPAPRGAGPAVF